MNIPYEKALRVAKSLKLAKPKKFLDLIEQFNQMSSGSDGGFFFNGRGKLILRDHYYPKWTDNDFKKILLELKDEKN